MQQIQTYLRAASVKAIAVDEYNNANNTKASLTRGMQAELILHLFKSDSADDKFTAADFAAIASWIWYADSDYDLTTTPKLIVESGISVDTDGLIHIPILETNTAEIIAYLGNAESKNLKCELVGLAAGDTKPTFVLQWEFSIRNRIGDEGGGSPAPVDDNHYTVAQVNALFAASNTVEYSADAGSSWSSSFVSGVNLIRYRNHAIEGAEWTSQNLTPGPQGPMPVISAGSAVSVPSGESPAVDIVPISGGYQVDFEIPAGAPGQNGQDGADGMDGISPVVSITQLESGVEIYASDAEGNETSGEILNGSLTMPIQPYSSDSAYSALTCISYNGGGYQVLSATEEGENPDNTPAKFVCFARPSDIPDFQPITSGGSAIVPQVNRVFEVPLSSGMVISVDSTGLTSSVCVTQELWLDMPTTPVSFTLPGFTWIDGIVPDFATGNTRYVLTVRWNGRKFLANSAYEESLA